MVLSIRKQRRPQVPRHRLEHGKHLFLWPLPFHLQVKSTDKAMLFNWKCLITLLVTVLSSDLFLMVYHIHSLPPHYLTDCWLGQFFYMVCLICNIILKYNFLQTYYRQTFHKLQTERSGIVLGCEFMPLIPGWKGTLLLCVHCTTQNPQSSTFWLVTVIWKPRGLFRCKEYDIRRVPSCTI